jgi:hypothetical protein
MRIDRSHFSWLLFTLVATALSTLLYIANFHPRSLPFHLPLPAFLGEAPPTRQAPGATPLGLIFGSVAFAIFLFASALGIRKKQRVWPMGNVRFWLKAHIWLTILTIPLVLFHCGFRIGGHHAQWLVVLYVIVMASGFFGLALQQFIPRMMKDGLPREVVFEQIPHLRGQLFAAAAGIRESLLARERSAASEAHTAEVAVAADPSIRVLVQFLDEDCLPYLAAPHGGHLRLGETGMATGVFRSIRLSVATEWRSDVDALEQWCNERRWMDLQTKFQHWLHGWLLVHVPASFALLVFTAWHAWAALQFLVI